MTNYALRDVECSVIQPLLPNKPRGVPRVDDRRVLNGIFWVLRTGAPWRALPVEFGPRTTLISCRLFEAILQNLTYGIVFSPNVANLFELIRRCPVIAACQKFYASKIGVQCFPPK